MSAAFSGAQGLFGRMGYFISRVNAVLGSNHGFGGFPMVISHFLDVPSRWPLCSTASVGAVQEEYQLVRSIGSGSFGQVFLVLHKEAGFD